MPKKRREPDSPPREKATRYANIERPEKQELPCSATNSIVVCGVRQPNKKNAPAPTPELSTWVLFDVDKLLAAYARCIADGTKPIAARNFKATAMEMTRRQSRRASA